MSGRPLPAALAEYLAVRRSLGFKLSRDGLLLEQFVSFCGQAGASRVTSELALAWVSAPAKASPGWLAMRLTDMASTCGWTVQALFSLMLLFRAGYAGLLAYLVAAR